MNSDFIHRRVGIPYTLHLERLQWPSRARATVILIHGIGSSTRMWDALINHLPDDVRIVAVDLLGFGESPKPEWAKYDAITQANSLAKTLLINRIPLGSLFIGHSLGGLVAVELARKFQFYPSQLVLISPPIYKPSRNKTVATQREDVLRGVYKILKRYPKNTERALTLAKRYYIRRTGVSVERGINITAYISTLEASIINQTTIDYIGKIHAPITILSGTRDPLVITKNLHTLAERVDSISYIPVKTGGHNIVGAMQRATASCVRDLLEGR